MSAALLLPRKKFTFEEVERMLEMGLFEGERYELIDGELIDKLGQRPPHSFSISQLLVALLRFFEPNRIRVQLPIQAAGKDRKLSMPEPDVAVIQEPERDYSRRHPPGGRASSRH